MDNLTWDNLTPDNLTPRTIWHCGQFDIADNFSPQTHWETMDNNGQQWATMGNIGQHWTTMDNNGHLSMNINVCVPDAASWSKVRCADIFMTWDVQSKGKLWQYPSRHKRWQASGELRLTRQNYINALKLGCQGLAAEKVGHGHRLAR